MDKEPKQDVLDYKPTCKKVKWKQ